MASAGCTEEAATVRARARDDSDIEMATDDFRPLKKVRVMASAGSTEEAGIVIASSRHRLDTEMAIDDYTCDSCKLGQRPGKWWNRVEEEGESTKWLCESCTFEVERDARRDDESIYAQAWRDRNTHFENLHKQMRYDDALAAAKRHILRKAEEPLGG